MLRLKTESEVKTVTKQKIIPYMLSRFSKKIRKINFVNFVNFLLYNSCCLLYFSLHY